MVKSKLEQEIIDALEAVAQDHGIDVVDVEIVGATKAPCVRVRLDRLDGESISLEDVTAQSAWVSDCVEQLDPIAGPYTLEVSSPGMARPCVVLPISPALWASRLSSPPRPCRVVAAIRALSPRRPIRR